MTASATPSLVLRNTSLTMRQRFTPARSCSTWTRICANFWLVRFSASVSSPRGGFFFRLAGFLHRRLIALESGVLVQGGVRRIGDPFLIGYLFVVRLARARSAEVVNPFPPDVDDDHVLVAMLLLTPTVKQGLFFGFFGLWRRRSVASMISRGAFPEAPWAWAKCVASRSGRTPRSSRAKRSTGNSR
jgi:hypothetical protein